jgi:hypothetical protein
MGCWPELTLKYSGSPNPRFCSSQRPTYAGCHAFFHVVGFLLNRLAVTPLSSCLHSSSTSSRQGG